MKRICFFACDFQTGGASGVTVNLANELCKRYKVYFLAAHDNASTLYGKENIDPSIEYFNLALEQERILKMRKKIMPRLKSFIREHDIDIVFAVGYYAAFYAAPIMWKNRKCKFVYCEHGAPANQITDRKGTLMRKISVRAYDMTVALTHRSEQDFVRLIGAKPQRVCTVYNWIDEATICENAVYDINNKKILTAARISEEKGFDLLADIAKRVFERCSGWEWHIMGDGPDREKFEAKIKEYGIEKNIVMHGMVADASKYFGDYAIIALTSYREGLPLMLLEALAKKTPCISFDVVTGPAEIIRDGVNGYLVSPYDCEKYADMLCKMMEDNGLRQTFSDNALLDVEKFKKQKILGEWIKLIEVLS